jgi:hypothetical protein
VRLEGLGHLKKFNMNHNLKSSLNQALSFGGGSLDGTPTFT